MTGPLPSPRPPDRRRPAQRADDPRQLDLLPGAVRADPVRALRARAGRRAVARHPVDEPSRPGDRPARLPRRLPDPRLDGIRTCCRAASSSGSRSASCWSSGRRRPRCARRCTSFDAIYDDRGPTARRVERFRRSAWLADGLRRLPRRDRRRAEPGAAGPRRLPRGLVRYILAAALLWSTVTLLVRFAPAEPQPLGWVSFGLVAGRARLADHLERLRLLRHHRSPTSARPSAPSPRSSSCWRSCRSRRSCC